MPSRDVLPDEAGVAGFGLPIAHVDGVGRVGGAALDGAAPVKRAARDGIRARIDVGIDGGVLLGELLPRPEETLVKHVRLAVEIVHAPVVEGNDLLHRLEGVDAELIHVPHRSA